MPELPEKVRRTLGARMAVFRPGAQEAVLESPKPVIETQPKSDL